MRQKYLLLLVFMFTLPLAQKIGYTNVELIMSGWSEINNMEKSLSELEESLRPRITQLEEQYQLRVEEYSMLMKSKQMSEQQEISMRSEIMNLKGNIDDAREKAEARLNQKRSELMTPRQEKLQKAIDEVAQEGDYTYILNNAMGAGIPTILYGMESHDVTLDIAKRLGIPIQ